MTVTPETARPELLSPETAADMENSFQKKMVELRARFILRTQADAITIRTLREQMAGNPLADPEPLKQLIRTVHGLAGAAGVFGFAQISNAAHKLEMSLRQIDGVDDDPNILLDALETELNLFWLKSASEGETWVVDTRIPG